MLRTFFLLTDTTLSGVNHIALLCGCAPLRCLKVRNFAVKDLTVKNVK